MSPSPVFEQLLGERFAELAPALRRFHGLRGRHELHGQVDTEPPDSAPGLVLAWCLGSPRRAAAGPIRFELDASPAAETWTRHFPGRTMRSRLSAAGDRLEERMGAARLRFLLDVQDGTLTLRLVRLRFLGVPCPAWLRPRLLAVERGEGDRLHFHIEARVPGIGRVVGYRGWLTVPGATTA